MAKSQDTNTVRYLRRLPREPYGHEEAEITLGVPEDQLVYEVLARAKVDVLDVLNASIDDLDVDTMVEKAEEYDQTLKPEQTDVTNTTVNPSTIAGEDEGVMPELEPLKLNDPEVAAENTLEPEKKKRGRKPKKVEEDEIELEGEDDFGFDDEPVKKNKTKIASTPFDRTNKTHQTLISGVLTELKPKWKTELNRDEVKRVAQELNGDMFLDGDGEIVESFKDRLANILKIISSK